MNILPALVLLFTLALHFTAVANDFTRNMPDLKFTNSLTPEKLKNLDAIIILKEQSYNSTPKDYTYHGSDFSGLAIVRAKILIVKLLTEAGVKRYGSFEYEFRERFGDDFMSAFEVCVRVMKPDGTINTMDEENVSIIVTRETSDGTPLARKALFKIPDLAAGDVVQIEYIHSEPFSFSSSGIFFYNDRDPVLYSNVYITLPAKTIASFVSLPPNRVAQPKVDQVSTTYGAGETYFWGLKNLNRIPEEPYARTFADQSILTAFTLERYEPSGMHAPMSWDYLAKDFYKHELDEDDVSTGDIARLGFSPKEPAPTMETVDRLYTALRKEIHLDDDNSVYPLSSNISSVFKKKKGDASDVSYIMMNILKHWRTTAQAVLIRDKREGVYERSVPAMTWFDRLGVLVTVNGQEKLYDFDRSIPHTYEQPWFVNDIDVVVIHPDRAEHKRIGVRSDIGQCVSRELHRISFASGAKAKDSLTVRLNGAQAQHYRNMWYDAEESDLHNNIRSLLLTHTMSDVDTATMNGFLAEKEISIRGVGTSAARVSRIDSFITFAPKNHLLRSLHDKIYSASRLSDLLLDEPFKLKMDWEITIPQGYALAQPLAGTSSTGAGNSSYAVSYTLDRDRYTISAEGTFPETIIMLDSYKQFTSFLQTFTEAVEKEVVFRRVK
ncbi:MAG: DUF3857 domain-containing protein [Ignavibacteriae bacterium]|nr:DUF3857 domain-containing protein [Ignavibacteriota bacterium]